ncbi:MAG: multiheme c-type cytochrome [Planctomycetota bacterium]|jgi:hypothetical protein
MTGRTSGPAGCLAALVGVACAIVATGPATAQVPTTIDDFSMPGTQPTGNPVDLDPFRGAIDGNCVNCHANFDPQYLENEMFRTWVGGMMAQATRDLSFLATMSIANQDAAFAGDLCLRCHTPSGWLGGRSVPTDGSALTEPADFEGVTCHFCHRLVDPAYVPGTSPPEDVPILDDLAAASLVPAMPGSGRYVVDPDDRVRRGPRDNVNHPQGATALYSPFHKTSHLCGTCHDVSNPVFSRQMDGSYVPNTLGAPHPDMNEHNMFPIERTYSEWLMSDFATVGVQMNGRFGGNHATGIMSSCQDCHMPDTEGPGCRNSGTVRPDSPQHALNGGNTWVLHSVRTMDVDGDGQPDWPDEVTGLTDAIVNEAQARVEMMLEAASDMTLTQDDDVLRVRITNYGAHKLPSGYPEGRRIWINVQFFDDQDQLIGEHGAYDFVTADLDTASTKVYEAKLGLDATMAGITGLPEGESFHFALNNVWLKDNRIPPIGFTNAAFESVLAAPVGYAYADGQHWDDTDYPIPSGADEATVTLWYQSTSKEYVEFLRDENVTDNNGQAVYDEWVAHGRSAPVAMDSMEIHLDPVQIPGDATGDGLVDVADLLLVLGEWGPCPAPPTECPADVDGTGEVDVSDLLMVLGNWS